MENGSYAHPRMTLGIIMLMSQHPLSIVPGSNGEQFPPKEARENHLSDRPASGTPLSLRLGMDGSPTVGEQAR